MVGNVVGMPDPFERRAQRIEAAMARRAKGDEEWIEGTLELATELVGARADHGDDDRKFGIWLKGRFGSNQIPHQDRAILIREGKDLGQMRIALEKTDNRSLQRIFTTNSKDASAKTPPVGGAKTKSVHAAIQTNEALGNKLSQRDLAEMLGVSTSTVGEATRDLKAAQAAETITYTKAQEYHIEARVKAIVKARLDELEKDFETRVIARNQEEIAKLFPMLQELQEQAKLNEKYYRDLLVKNSIFTKSEGLDILRACHPDNSATDEVRKRAFIAVNAKKSYMQGEG